MEYRQATLLFHRDGRGRSLIGFEPVCETCGEPAPEPHRHLSVEVAAIVQELKKVQRPAETVEQREYLSLRELARYSGWSVKTMQEWARDPVDPVPSFRPGGGKAMFRRQDYDAWYARRMARKDRGSTVSGIVRGVLDDLQQRGGR